MSEEIKKQNEQVEDVTDNKKQKVEEPENKPEVKEVTMTQEELDALISREKGRVKKKYEDYDEIKARLEEFTRAEEERKKAEMTEAERLKLEKEEAEKQAKSAMEKANQRLIKSEFRSAAKDFGVRKDALEDLLLFADMTSVKVDDEGNVYGVKESIESLKKSKGYLFSKDYADPTPGKHETKRESVPDQAKKKLQELAEKARKSGKIEDKVAYARLKSDLGL